MKNPFFDLWLSALREGLRTGSMAAIEHQINDMGLDTLLSPEFFSHVQQADARELVVLIATLGMENAAEPAPFKRWLAAYRCLQGQQDVASAAQDCVAACGGQPSYYQAVLAALPAKAPAPDIRRTPASADDLKFGIELLVLAHQSGKVLPLLKAWETIDASGRPWLLACRALLSRLDDRRSRSESAQLARTLAQLLETTPPSQEELVETLRGRLVQLALKGQEGAMALETAKLLKTTQDSGTLRFLHMRALMQTGDLPAAQAEGDALLHEIATGQLQLDIDKEENSGSFNIGHALDTLDVVNKALAGKGLKPFLMSGTLLGFERNGSLLPHDKDIDLGVIGWENQFSVVEALLATQHFYVDTQKLRGERCFLISAWDMRNNMAVDFFFFHDKGDHFLHGIDFDYGFTLNYKFTPFDVVQRDYGGKTYWTPANAALNLQENYGNWQVPEPHYVVTVESPGIAYPDSAEHRLCAQLELIKIIGKRLPSVRVHRVLDHLQSHGIAAVSPATTQALKGWADKYSAPKASRLKDMLAKIRAKTPEPVRAAPAPQTNGPKVLLVGHGFGPDGAAMMLKKTARYWTQQLGWTVEGYAPTAVDDDEMLAHGITPVRELAVSDHQLVVFNSLLVAESARHLSAAVPKALWVHEGQTLVSSWGWSAQTWAHLFKPFDALIFQTRWQTETVFAEALQKTPAAHIHIVPNGIDWPFAAKTRAANARPTPGETLKILCVASLTGRKRPHDLANAVLALAAQRPVQCTFIGDLSRLDTLPPDFQDLAQQGHPALRFTGPLSQAEIAGELQRAHIFCLPSGDESYPLAPLEAALAGVPVVQTELAPYPHIGWQTDVNCLSYPVGDVAGLQAQLLRLADEAGLAQRLSATAHEFARGMSFESFCQNITAPLQPLLKAQSPLTPAEPIQVAA